MPTMYMMFMPFIRPFDISILILVLHSFSYSQDYSNVPYGPEARQFMDIYIVPSSCPTPVYFHAHFNGGTTALPNHIVDSLTSNGISIVSWESLTTVSTQSAVQIGWNDADLMFNWVIANADTYNFDKTNFIVGGSSRGTILSWKYAHTPNPNIKGLYMYNALPSNVWADSTWWYPPNEITPASPPVFFVYRREPGCSTDPIDPNIHDPNNGITVQNKYSFLGIGERDTLIHSLIDSSNTDRFQFLLEFAKSVIEPCSTVNIYSYEKETPNIHAFPNPFQDKVNISGLTGGETLILRNNFGKVLVMKESQGQMELGHLDAGVYLLTIELEGLKKTIKLIKK